MIYDRFIGNLLFLFIHFVSGNLTSLLGTFVLSTKKACNSIIAELLYEIKLLLCPDIELFYF